MKEKKESPTWWAASDPRKTKMYRYFWNMFAWMTFTGFFSLAFVDIFQDVYRITFPTILYKLWLIFFASQLIIYNRAQNIIRKFKNGSSKEIEENVPLKKINRKPGWLIVLIPWFFAWHLGLLLIYDRLFFSFEVTFSEPLWFWGLVIITGIFNLSDAARQILAERIESSWLSLLSKIIEVVFQHVKDRQKSFSDPPTKTE